MSQLLIRPDHRSTSPSAHQCRHLALFLPSNVSREPTFSRDVLGAESPKSHCGLSALEAQPSKLVFCLLSSVFCLLSSVFCPRPPSSVLRLPSSSLPPPHIQVHRRQDDQS